MEMERKFLNASSNLQSNLYINCAILYIYVQFMNFAIIQLTKKFE